MSAPVHWRACGRGGLGSPATQLMRAVRPPPPGWENDPRWLRPARIEGLSIPDESATTGRDTLSRTEISPISRSVKQAWLVYPGRWRGLRSLRGGIFDNRPGYESLERQVFAGFEVGGASVAGAFWPAQWPSVSLRVSRRRQAGQSRVVGFGVAGVAERGLTNACS